MDTKLKKLNRTLLQLILIPVCAALFIGSLHFGIGITVNLNRLHGRVSLGKGYLESGQMLYELEHDLDRVRLSVFGDYFYGLEEELSQQAAPEAKPEKRDPAEAKQLLWNYVKPSLKEAEQYAKSEGFQFYVKFLDWSFESKGYESEQTENKKIVASLTSNAEKTTLGGKLSKEWKTEGSTQFVGDATYQFREVFDRAEYIMSQYVGSEISLEPGDIEILVGYTDEQIAQREQAFDRTCEKLSRNITGLALCAFGTLLLFIILCFITGRKDETGRIRLGGIDCWPTELFLLFIPSLVILGGIDIVEAFDSLRSVFYYSGGGYAYKAVEGWSLEYVIMLGIAWLIATLGLSLILCVVRKIKAGQLLKTCLSFRILRWCARGVSDVYYGGSAMRKMVLVILGACLLCATVISMPLVAGVLIVLSARLIRQYEAVKRGIDEIRSGNTGYHIPIEGNPKGEMQQLGAKVNEISEGFDLAVRREMKNQRMKSELISNVSHDLKTPMTSIITYIDLLKKEGLQSENAPRYLEILDEKSQRLKKLCEDLFEAAKASSGDMPVELSRLEMTSLVKQMMGEYQDRFQEKGLQILFHSDEERLYVMADGKLLWRVMENIFGNLLKYAMEDTRVYLDVRQIKREGQDFIVLDVKNMSKYPLNIPADELVERFQRGDESRNTEGSGLGLAIARDLTTLQKGQFDLTVDGDLFKVTILFKEVK